MALPVHTLARCLAWLRGFICAESCRGASISNVRDLKARMRTLRPGSPACVRLLNATGTVGCGAGRTAAPIAVLEDPIEHMPKGIAPCLHMTASIDTASLCMHLQPQHLLSSSTPHAPCRGIVAVSLKSKCKPAHSRVTLHHLLSKVVARAGQQILLLWEEHLPLILQRLSKEKHLRAQVEGLLVSSGNLDAPTASPAEKFPLAAYAPYKDSSYPWNPNGTGISNLDIRIPIFYLEESLRASAYSSALQNRQQVDYQPSWSSSPQACRS